MVLLAHYSTSRFSRTSVLAKPVTGHSSFQGDPQKVKGERDTPDRRLAFFWLLPVPKPGFLFFRRIM